MKQLKLDVCVKDGLEKIVEFLNSHNIASEYVNLDKYNYSRTIQFVVNNQSYQIVWFINESKLRIGTDTRSPFVVFKHMYYDNCLPIVGGEQDLTFSVYEHRNSDEIIINGCETSDVKSYGAYNGNSKYSYLKNFSFDQHYQVAKQLRNYLEESFLGLFDESVLN